MSLDDFLPECKLFDIYKGRKLRLILKQFFTPYLTYCYYQKHDLESNKYVCMYDVITNNSPTLVDKYVKHIIGEKE